MGVDSVTDEKQPVTLSWELDPNQVIAFDATVREEHTGRSEITSFPIEAGSDHADHIRRLPDELALEVAITDSPIVQKGKVVEPANTGGDISQRATSGYNFLVQTKDQGKLVSIFTTLRTYRNMAIESIDVSRDVLTSRIVQANLQLREVLVAVTEQVEAPVPIKTAKRRKVNRGKKEKDEASDANKKKASVVLQGLQKFGINI